jgi:peptidoglycan hydrolase CwlO-like protein
MYECCVCGKYFDRGTSILPNYVCDKHLNCIETIEIKRTTKEEIEHWNNIINSCLEEIDKYNKKIKENQELITYAKDQINITKI